MGTRDDFLIRENDYETKKNYKQTNYKKLKSRFFYLWRVTIKDSEQVFSLSNLMRVTGTILLLG